eukprot:9285776-Lingulodinium_polyedra.AAC.1
MRLTSSRCTTVGSERRWPSWPRSAVHARASRGSPRRPWPRSSTGRRAERPAPRAWCQPPRARRSSSRRPPP